MRMRKKKNLDSRLEAVGDYLTDCEYKDLNFKNAKDNRELLDLEKIYGNGNPLVLEIGCGKGTFACTYAQQHPEINLLAVEMDANVIVSACEKAKETGLKNIHFMRCNAQYLPAYLAENSVTAIFLNFSCPYPKNTYANHRLTHKAFLDIYKELMTENAVICQKTDNRKFFEFSIESLSQNGFKLSNISLDLQNSDFEGNIVTEYEQKFIDEGKPIYRLEARL